MPTSHARVRSIDKTTMWQPKPPAKHPPSAETGILERGPERENMALQSVAEHMSSGLVPHRRRYEEGTFKGRDGKCPRGNESS